ncbi:ATP-dependent DNA helicase RecQ [Ascidiimonas aurantiaca]|uniref:RecQ family ATP-dependent DNA helicase n=1 Tax=Ascidiimonas aurantiaca TaxID=1685432 RepID=UPI0030ECC5F4
MNQPNDILKKYWGYDNFRPPQEQAIQSVLKGQDTLVLLPTGGGKSLCFQIPALASPGICIVVSPLIALMNDQVQQLRAKGIKAISLAGNLSYSELDTLLDNCVYGNYRFLYISPERLKHELVLARIKQMAVNSIAVDEAHCISQWGNDFRPAYKDIVRLRDIFPHVPVIALTASATPRVVNDIITDLKLTPVHTFKKSFARPNLAYRVIHTENKLAKTEHLLKEYQGTSIIYVRSRKATVEVAEYLKKRHITTTFYHGGISSEEKTKRLQQWMDGEVRVMIATNAFGMGIDKPDVRTVIHLALPENLENYYQEAGRAGRDLKKAAAFLITSRHDITLVKKQFLSVLPDVNFVKTLYRKLCAYFQVSYGEGEFDTYQLEFYRFCETYRFPVPLAYNAMKLLDRYGVLRLSETFHRKTTVHFAVPGSSVLAYLKRNPSFEVVTKALLRTYGGIFDLETSINTHLIASKTKVSEAQVFHVLKHLAQDGLINYTASHTDAEITFLQPREDEKTINVIARHIKEQNKHKEEQVKQIIAYATNVTRCKSEWLLSYFGEKNTTPCGICSFCQKPDENVSQEKMVLLRQDILKALEKDPKTSTELVRLFTFTEKTVLEALRYLAEQDRIQINQKNQYTVKI